METYCGYAGAILEIDLTHQRVCRIPLPETYAMQLLSGKALAAQMMLDHTTGTETALSAENIMVFTASLLTGTGAPGAERFDVGSLSPKDDLPAFSNCGGPFGLRLKQAGYDALLLKGACSRPSWLEISQDRVVFHDAGDLWGLGTGECRERLTKLLDDHSFGSICIGPAGEHLVQFASLLADSHSTGRAGFGAVLGRKQLKAITVMGHKKIPLHDPQAVSEVNRRWLEQLRRSASQQERTGFCPDCPLHCIRHRRNENPLLEELGMDAIAAEAVTGNTKDPELYRAIAFRRDIGAQLAEGTSVPKGNSGKRRNVCHARIAEAFGLGADSGEFCRNYTEAVCAFGQCMFTVNGLRPGMEEIPILPAVTAITGKSIALEDLLNIGRHSRELEHNIIKRFEQKITSA